MLLTRLFGLLALAACATVASADETVHADVQVLLVSQTNPSAHFKTIVEAVASVEATVGHVEIHVEAGVYVGAFSVKRAAPLTIRAVADAEVTITQGGVAQGQLIQQQTSSFYTSTITVSGSTDFKIYGCIVENLQVSSSIAPAIFVGAGTASFYNVSLHAQQQTIYVGATARVYARACTIKGSTDFVAGSGTIYVTASLLHSVGYGSIVAWRAAISAEAQVTSNTQTLPAPAPAKQGCYVVDSKVKGSTPSSVTLARPLTDGLSANLSAIVHAAAATVIYLGTDLGECVKPQGWSGVQLSVDIAARLKAIIDARGSFQGAIQDASQGGFNGLSGLSGGSKSNPPPADSKTAASVSKQITQQAHPNFVEAGCTGAGAANGKQRDVGLAVGLSAAVKVATSISAVFGDTSFIDLGVGIGL